MVILLRKHNHINFKLKTSSFFCLVCLLLTLPVLAQEKPRGSMGTENTSKTGTIRALIVGVSDYKSESLQLAYADADASIFSKYLEDVEAIAPENLTTLIADGSTDKTLDQLPNSSNILTELQRLRDESQEGDIVYFYFAGHGDVVDDMGYEEGFLLASDANPDREYYGTSGVVSLKHLNNVITEVTDKGAKFVLVLDACRSGFLYTEGTQKNLETFNNNFQHSTKFFSCGPNQLSYESKEIGHGYFTYYLILGLLGAADNLVPDNNLQYFELATFLDKEVKNHTDAKQAPIVWHQNTVGIYKAVSTKDKDAALNSLQGSVAIHDILASRGNSDESFTQYSSNPIVKQFNEALKSENFYGNATAALELYRKASNENLVDPPLQNRMKNALVSALTTNAQILINTYIGNANVLPSSDVFSEKAKHLEVCTELLDKNDFNYDRVYMSKLFLEAYAVIRAKRYSKYPEAKRKLQEALDIENRAAYVHNALGIVLNHENNYEDAEKHYKKAKELIPSWSFPVANLGTNFYDQYQYDNAKKYYSDARKLNDTSATVYNNLGAVSESQGKYTEAEAYYNKALENDHDSFALRNLGLIYRNKGNIKKAVAFYELALQANPNDVHTYYSFSDILNDENIDNKRAEDLLQQAIQLEPYFSIGHAEYADLLRQYPRNDNSLVEAMNLYNFAIENDPFYEWGYAGKGWLLHKQKNETEALQSFQKGIEMNPKKPKPYYYLANFYESGLKNVAKSEEFYLKAIEKDSFYLPAYEDLIDLYNKNDEETKSLSLLNKLSKWNADAPDIWNLLGNTHYDMGNYTKAIEAYQTSIAIDSTYAKGLSNLAYSYLKNGDYEKATPKFKQAVTYNPYQNSLDGFSIVLLSEARKQKRQGNAEAALQIFKEAYHLDANFDTAFALAELYYFERATQNAMDIIEALDHSTLSKSRQLKFYELASKIAIDLKSKEKANRYIALLRPINPRTDHILEALVHNLNGDKKLAKESLSQEKSIMLSDQFLTNKYSQNTINTINNLK